MDFLESLVLGALAVLLLFFTARGVLAASRIRRLDADLPAALFSMASYESHVPLESILSEVSACVPDPLKSALRDCVRQVRSGVPFGVALTRLGKKYPSALLDRVVQLLQAAHQSVADLSDAFRKVAEDAHEFQRLQALRRESFAVQKYTLYAGAVLVPGLLGLLFSWMHAADSPYGTSVFWGLQVYLGAFGFLSSAFVAAVESDFHGLAQRGALLSVFVLWVFHAVRLGTVA